MRLHGLANVAWAAMVLAGCVERGGVAELGPQAAIRLAAEVRHLPPKKVIRAGWIDQEDLGPRFAAMITPEERAAIDDFGAVMHDLGLYEDPRPLTAVLLSAMETQVAGFYDPRDKVLFAVRRPPTAPLERTMVLVHEGVHALQDQHGLMPKFGDQTAGLDDFAAAQQAVVEGDATVAMLLGVVRHRGGSRQDEANAVGGAALMINGAIQAFVNKERVSPVVGEALAFPYAAGFTWVVFGPMKKGWDQVDAEMRTPPVSTERILHPKLGEVPEAWPLVIGFDVDLGGAGWDERATTVFGERWHRFIFGQYGQPMSAADGWGGDRVRHFREPRTGKSLTFVATSWDTLADADQAEAAWARVSPSTRLGMARDGLRVVLAFGDAEAGREVPALLNRMLESWREVRASTRDAAESFMRAEAAGQAGGIDP